MTLKRDRTAQYKAGKAKRLIEKQQRINIWKSKGFVSVPMTDSILINKQSDIYSIAYDKILKVNISKNGYRSIPLKIEKKYKYFLVHRLMMLTFNPHHNHAKLCVDHIDGNRSNNHIENLRWATHKENINYAVVKKTHPHGETCGKSTLNNKIVYEMIQRYLVNKNVAKFPMALTAKQMNISRGHVKQILNGKTWKHIHKQIKEENEPSI